MYKSGIVSINGVVSSLEDAKISIQDRGFLFGDSIFEVIVGFHGTPLHLKRHLKRLRNSAGMILMDLPYSDDELSFLINNLLSICHMPKANIRLMVSRGTGLGLDPTQKNLQPNLMVLITPAAPSAKPTRFGAHGVSLKLKHQQATKRGANAKTNNYLEAIVSIKQHRQEGEGWDDILWVNAQGEVQEASTANIFFLGREGDSLIVTTPSEQSGILSGITRQVLLELFAQAKIRAEPSLILEDELARFDEAFLCSTVRGLIPVERIQDKVFYTCRPTAVFQHLSKLFNTHVATELGFYVDWDSGKKLPRL